MVKISKNVSDLEAHVGFWMRFVSNQVSGEFEKRLTEQGVTVTEWVALRALFRGESATHADLIEALGMTKGAASKVVSRLEAKSLAARTAVDGSGRGQSLILTDAGRALVPILAAIADENDDRFFGVLEGGERRTLEEILRKLVAIHGLKEVPID